MNGQVDEMRRAARQWSTAASVLAAAGLAATAAAQFGMLDVAWLCWIAAGYATARHSRLDGWCLGWQARGLQELRDSLRRRR